MGEVWRAMHRGQQPLVAVKVITAPMARVPRARRELAREVRKMASLVHPRILMVRDQLSIILAAMQLNTEALVIHRELGS